MSKLHKRVWSNNNLTVNTKMLVYKACVLSTLLYSSESWTSYAAQERRLNTFHLRCLWRILGIKWQDRIPNTDVLEQAGLPTIFTLLSQRRLRWLGHVRRMEDGRIPKDLLYGELSEGSRPRGRPRLRFKDTCKRDLRSARIETQSWEDLAESRDRWRAAVHSGTAQAEQVRTDQQKEKRAVRKSRSSSADQPATSDSLLPVVRERLPLTYRPLQPRKEMQQPGMMMTNPCNHRLARRKGPTTTTTEEIMNK